ncbi:hypothetical protein [Flavobacterium filum]|uniref:hypothetical protein n=1 Tax=Flavobacterium filum TaxID=370974 RepID=UPI0023F526C2|nr:hypothetical protein [Flavobacterium filum]
METPFYKRLWFGVGLIAFFLILTTIIVGYTLVNRYQKKRDEAATKTISEILKQESNSRPHLPDILVINVSAKDQKQISDSIRNEVLKYLLKRYTLKSADTSKIEIHPYVSFLEKSNDKPITGEQLEELKKYIEFLVTTCNKAVEDSRQNIDTEISKINTWVTIWIGVFGLLGIFIPIVVNLKSLDTLKEIETKADDADKILTEHRDDIKAIAGIKKDVAVAKADIQTITTTTLPDLKKQSETALQDATTALAQATDNQRVVQAMEAILKLSKLQNIVLYGSGNVVQLIHSLLSSFLRSFRLIDDNYNGALYQDLLIEFFDRITELGRSTILRNRVNTQAISVFATFLNGKINSGNPLTITDHNEIVTNFETMLDGLNA